MSRWLRLVVLAIAAVRLAGSIDASPTRPPTPRHAQALWQIAGGTASHREALQETLDRVRSSCEQQVER